MWHDHMIMIVADWIKLFSGVGMAFQFIDVKFCVGGVLNIYNMGFSEVGRTIKNLINFIIRELDWH